ncbi:hypothetical protein QQS21_000682 [Conoideocrella luteorostrata]|uniref:Kelch repeat protein n=1 Tax=Conoideocrella luteorostrata TaxID=1105319 RepID=A0AAJ0D123_9HYPO|nr:hypothetical protein QQS21_000682 [Conoideocrella luteorostrata]
MSPLHGRWSQIVSHSRLCRSSQALSVHASKAYVFGGEVLPRQPIDNQIDLVSLDAEARGEFQTLAANKAPSPRVGTASVTAHDNIWLFSGRGGLAMDPIEEQGNLWRYSTAESEWELVRTTSSLYPAARSYHATAFDGKNTIFLHAGCPAQGRLSDLWAFDIKTLAWTELPHAPGPARGGTSIAFCNGKLYRMGGFDGEAEQGGSIDVYEPSTKTWDTILFEADGTKGPTARSVAALVAVQTSAGEPMLISMFGEGDPSSLGHAGAGKMINDVWSFSVGILDWRKIEFAGGNAPTPRGWFAADVLREGDGDAVIVHGGLAEDNSRLGDVWRLDL